MPSSTPLAPGIRPASTCGHGCSITLFQLPQPQSALQLVKALSDVTFRQVDYAQFGSKVAVAVDRSHGPHSAQLEKELFIHSGYYVHAPHLFELLLKDSLIQLRGFIFSVNNSVSGEFACSPA